MKVAAFNVQRFGTNKISDPQVVSILIQIVSRYDIIVILEVVDARGKSVKTFLEELNKANTEHHYTMEISTRLGRTKYYKEQYLFLYRDDLVDLIDTYQFADNQEGQEDVFAREPYVLRFACHNTVMSDLVLMPVHTQPAESEKELDELYDVFQDVKRRWKTDNIMILGDFNADGSYVSKKEMKELRIRSDKKFHWLIGDDVDTTANNRNDHTYDRIVVYGDDMLAAVVPHSAKPFNFQQEYGLTDEQTLDVSDHYPVEVELKKSTKSRKKPHTSTLPSSLGPVPQEVMKVAAFNVQRFGTNKISDPQVVSILIQIVSRYDIILILEVVDARGKSVQTFLEELNKANKEHHYTMEISTRLGRTRYKEQYLFLYRDDLVDLIDTYQFADNQEGQEDVFAREPYVLRFTCHNTVMSDLVLMPVRTHPAESEKELDELYDVFQDVKRRWKTDNIMILGDFNADGSYVSKKEMKELRIRSDKKFHWLISDDVDTTANNRNDHTYDRIVVYGDDMLAAVVPHSAKPFNFQQEYGLTDEQTLDVSDRYPVEVELKKSTKSKWY